MASITDEQGPVITVKRSGDEWRVYVDGEGTSLRSDDRQDALDLAAEWAWRSGGVVAGDIGDDQHEVEFEPLDTPAPVEQPTPEREPVAVPA